MGKTISKNVEQYYCVEIANNQINNRDNYPTRKKHITI